MTFQIATLDQKIRAATANWPPLLRIIAVAMLHIGPFMVVCGTSYLRLPMGSTIAGALLGVFAFASPLTGLLFILIAVNFQYLFWFDPGALYRIGIALSVVYVLRSIPITLRESRRFSPLWIVLASFIGIVVLHLSPEVGIARGIQAIGFCVLAAAIFLHSRNVARTPDAAAMAATICISGFMACALSFAFLYLPAPELFLSRSPVYDLSANDFRLSGAQDNPNAMAKLLAPGIIALILLPRGLHQANSIWLILLGACIVFLAATGSKSMFLALFAVALVLSGTAAKRHLLIAWSLAVITALAAVLLFTGAVLPFLKHHAADAWQKYNEPNINTAYYVGNSRQSFVRTLLRELRIQVLETPAVVPAKTVRDPNQNRPIVESPPADTLAATSQRLWAFKAGLVVISRHPWWGIGYKQWAAAMQEITGFPFLSPHNGLLELWGSYGVLGGLLYVALIAIAARNYIVIRKFATDSLELWLNRAIGLFLLAILLHEMLEVATVLAVTPYALWAWTALGIQDGMAQRLLPRPKSFRASGGRIDASRLWGLRARTEG